MPPGWTPTPRAGARRQSGLALLVEAKERRHRRPGKLTIIPSYVSYYSSISFFRTTKKARGKANRRSPSEIPEEEKARAEELLEKFKTIKKGKKKEVATCEICNQNFTAHETMIVHIKTQHAGHSIPCTYKDCDRTFTRKDSLTYHINRHHLNRFR